jgi:hypothetical protein
MKKPQELSKDEVKEVCQIEFIRESWGAENAKEMEEIFDDSIYAVKFDFFSASPGYVGDLYILQGDTLTGDAPVILIRGKDGKMMSAY